MASGDREPEEDEDLSDREIVFPAAVFLGTLCDGIEILIRAGLPEAHLAEVIWRWVQQRMGAHRWKAFGIWLILALPACCVVDEVIDSMLFFGYPLARLTIYAFLAIRWWRSCGLRGWRLVVCGLAVVAAWVLGLGLGLFAVFNSLRSVEVERASVGGIGWASCALFAVLLVIVLCQIEWVWILLLFIGGCLAAILGVGLDYDDLRMLMVIVHSMYEKFGPRWWRVLLMKALRRFGQAGQPSNIEIKLDSGTKIPLRTCTDDDDDGACAICLDEFTGGDVVADLPCNHHFHADCAREWFDVKPQCPYCRRWL
jgi:hypothetical protein